MFTVKKEIKSHLSQKEIQLTLATCEELSVAFEENKALIEEKRGFLRRGKVRPIIEGVVGQTEDAAHIRLAFKLRKADGIVGSIFFLLPLLLSCVLLFLQVWDVAVVIFAWDLICLGAFALAFRYRCRRLYRKIQELLTCSKHT